MELAKNRNKTIQCNVCSRYIRSDHLKRHAKTHKDILSMSEDEMREEMRQRKKMRNTREELEQLIRKVAEEEGEPIEHWIPFSSPSVSLSKVNIREEMDQHKEEYLAMIEAGREIALYIIEGNVPEGSLTRVHKQALDVYRKERSLEDFSETQLKPWQQLLMNIIEVPSYREVIWVIGKKGNEGKSWFQDYLESWFGFNRVSRVDFRIKHTNMCNVLKKKPLTSVDMFLFNDGRSVTEDENSDHYRILENIKDGQATTSKYNNDVIKFKKPNTVIVFSNTMPDYGNLSMDRWKAFRIKNNELVALDDNDSI